MRGFELVFALIFVVKSCIRVRSGDTNNSSDLNRNT